LHIRVRSVMNCHNQNITQLYTKRLLYMNYYNRTVELYNSTTLHQALHGMGNSSKQH